MPMTNKAVFDPAIPWADRALLERHSSLLIRAGQPIPPLPRRGLGIRLSAARSLHHSVLSKAIEHRASYVIPADLDRTSRDLLDRAQTAVDRVLRSQAHQAGMLDAVKNQLVLPQRLWDI